MWKWQLVLSALATFTTAFAAPMPSVTIDVQKVDETIEPVPRIARFDYEAKDGLLLRNRRGAHLQRRAARGLGKGVARHGDGIRLCRLWRGEGEWPQGHDNLHPVKNPQYPSNQTAFLVVCELGVVQKYLLHNTVGRHR